MLSEAVERMRARGSHLWEYGFTPQGAAVRQLPITVVYLLTVALVPLAVTPRHPVLLVVGAALVVAMQVAAALVPWARLARGWRYLLVVPPLLAAALIDLGAGQERGSLDFLLFLPAINLALAPGLLGVGLALVGFSLVLFVPVLLIPDPDFPFVRALLTLLILTVVVLGLHATADTVRRQARELEEARDEVEAAARDLRRSRDLLRSVLAAATEQAIVATDEDGVVLLANAGAERLLGVPQEQLVGTRLGDLSGTLRRQDAPPEGGGGGPGRPLSLPQEEVAVGETEVGQLVRTMPDGSERHLEYVATRRPGLETADDPLPPGYLFVVTDTTERHAEERARERLLSMVSHELRTPLVSILGYLDLLQLEGDRLDEEQRSYLEVIARNARRLRALVDDLLLRARAASGLPMTPELIDVADVLHASVASETPMARGAEVALEVTGDASVPLVSDAERLRHVVDNLISNALKYSGPGSRIEVSAERAQGPQGQRAARIRVADQGAGIAPDELPRLTEPFFRSSDSRRRQVPGLGLGLSVAKSVVEQHGGTLSITSQLGEGTQVEALLPDLPLRQPEQPEQPEQPQQPQQPEQPEQPEQPQQPQQPEQPEQQGA
ncbi:sensor histidine kinase [Nocardioides campestrisoli]|uniref:sensor histidine kinase n=1 Tax=Nocardioides campestrisoli TaxID=2736757 RepID=UPI00163D7382|nr:ATP-binding protein [Nocardioides campestrisoli]